MDAMNATFRPVRVQNSIQNARADEYRKKYPWMLVSDWKFYWGISFVFFPPICLLVEFLGFMYCSRVEGDGFKERMQMGSAFRINL